MAWFRRESGDIQASDDKRVRTEGLWVKCEGCRQIIWKKELEDNLNVCSKCDYHFPISVQERVALLVDLGSFKEWETDLAPQDPQDYPIRGQEGGDGKQQVLSVQNKTAGALSLFWIVEMEELM